MSAQVWPPIPHDQLIKEEEDSLAAELEWLLADLQGALASLKSGLEECLALLNVQEPGTTLALSTLRSETVKGFVTRVGTRIIKGSDVAVLQDISLRISSLAPPRGQQSYPLHITSPLPLPQLSALLNLLDQTLDIIDISTWTGDPKNGSFISGQLRLLAETIDEAKTVMKGGEDVVGGKWWEDDFAGDETVRPNPPFSYPHVMHLEMSYTVCRTLSLSLISRPRIKNILIETPKIFTPPLPPTLSPHLTLTPTSLLLTIRTLHPIPQTSTPKNSPSTPNASSSSNTTTVTGLSLRTRLTQILAPMPAPTHDEADRVVVYRGQEVRVREKVRVESQDPSLMAVGAKLSAVGHAVEGWRYKLGIVMGEEMGEE
ncbi:MAG: hypothetical protein Q9208_008502 [Pyrenodesmia sp. 3 TL-2023]